MTEEKEIKQETLEGYVDAIEKQIDKGFIGLITEINNITNTDFFDSSAYDEKEGFGITIKMRGESAEEFSQWFSKPQMRGYEQSNMYAFKKKYGCVPKKGLEVTCHIDESGFFRITL